MVAYALIPAILVVEAEAEVEADRDRGRRIPTNAWPARITWGNHVSKQMNKAPPTKIKVKKKEKKERM